MWGFNKCKNGHKLQDIDILLPARGKCTIPCQECGKELASIDGYNEDMRVIIMDNRISVIKA